MTTLIQRAKHYNEGIHEYSSG